MDFRVESRQTQTLSPRLQHAVRLLQMSSVDFAAMVRDTLGRNPFLEAPEGEDDGADEAAADSALEDDRGDDRSDERELGDEPQQFESHDDDRDLWQADSGSTTRRAEEGELSALELMPVETSLTQHLHAQLNVLTIDPRDLHLARILVESLDDDGYLRCELDELEALAQLSPPPSAAEMQIALRRVQSLEPAGVAARTVAECLQLQMGAIDCAEQRALAKTIVEQHLPSLAARDINALARRVGVTPAQAEAVCDRIRRLDPRPGWRYGSTRVAYVVPDVIVKKVRGQWKVKLNPAIVPKVRLNQVYAELFQRHRNPAQTELAGHLQEARWTLRNVEQRFCTIVDVAEAIVKRQRHFLEFGAMAMKPLGLKEIADEIGVHESTVSRVTNNKYMATPCGVFELKYFFSRAMMSSNGKPCSGTAIRGLIKDLIEAEKPEAPLSDAEITRQLGVQGLVVARRTVTKYRQLLRIEAVEKRRRHVAA